MLKRKFIYFLIGGLFISACKNQTHEPNQVQSNIKVDSFQDSQKISNENQTNKNQLIKMSNLFVGKHSLMGFDGHSKPIEIKMDGEILGSNHYKYLRLIDSGNDGKLYFVKGLDEAKAQNDTFAFEKVNDGIKLYLLNQGKRIYKYTLIPQTK